MAAGQRLFIAVSGPCPEAVTTEGGWGFLRSQGWAAKGPGGPLRDLQGRVTGPRAAIFLMQSALGITEKDFRRLPAVWNGSSEEGASRGAGQGGAAVTGNRIRGRRPRRREPRIARPGPRPGARRSWLSGPQSGYRKPRGPPRGGGRRVRLTFDVGARHPTPR